MRFVPLSEDTISPCDTVTNIAETSRVKVKPDGDPNEDRSVNTLQTVGQCLINSVIQRCNRVKTIGETRPRAEPRVLHQSPQCLCRRCLRMGQVQNTAAVWELRSIRG